MLAAAAQPEHLPSNSPIQVQDLSLSSKVLKEIYCRQLGSWNHGHHQIDLACVQGFWDAVTLMSQHRRDDAPVAGAPLRTKSVAPTLAKLHEQKLAAQEAQAQLS